MLNEVNPAVNRSVANGSTTVFAYTFKIDDQADVEVLVDDTVKTIGTHYTVDGVGVSGGGNITFLSAPANLSIITRLRKQPGEQLSDYLANGTFPSTVEIDLDTVVMMVQQLREILGRALKFKKSSSLVDQAVDEPTEGLFLRAKTGGGIDFATPTLASPASLPISIVNGGTGASTAANARTNLAVPPIASPTLTGTTLVDTLVATGASQVTALLASGILTAQALLDLSGAAAGQIKFPATQHPSSNGNTLDDYEEGTWTPVLTFSTAGNLNVVYGNQEGHYIKIGRLVTLWFRIETSTFTHSTASGNLWITGAPFAGAGTLGVNEGTLAFQGITKANYTQFTPEIAFTSTIVIQASGSGQAQGLVTFSNMPTGGTVFLEGTLRFDAGT